MLAILAYRSRFDVALIVDRIETERQKGKEMALRCRLRTRISSRPARPARCIPDVILSCSAVIRLFIVHSKTRQVIATLQLVEPNRMKWLFTEDRKRSVQDGKILGLATWAYLGYDS
ncbi:hypothetical protein [Rhodococcus sp. 14-1411-2a]|uniref:hypothetical protein n=1 Tax=Rhodococcus sp. 14-1411-2a TaxID=2023151 RepID=UPI0015C5FC6A|nr:hypothetical protein [Rhodococcus sp. 14-1411-2a]